MKNMTTNSIFRITQLLIIVLFVAFCQSITNSSDVKIKNENLNKNLDLTAMAELVENNIISSLYVVRDSYVGELTGYTADCPLCSGRLACMPNLDVLSGNTIYSDNQYGNVKIVAASPNLPCGTIIRFTSTRLSPEPTIAVVLDRGVGSNNIDILVAERDFAFQVGRSVVNYDVLREGWEK